MLLDWINLIWHFITSFLYLIEWSAVVAVLSTIVLWLQLSPAGKALPYLLLGARTGLVLAQLFMLYVKKHPQNKVTPNQFFAEIADHYLKTHPTGKQLAKKTELDNKLVEIILKNDDEVPGNG